MMPDYIFILRLQAFWYNKKFKINNLFFNLIKCIGKVYINPIYLVDLKALWFI